MYEKLEKAMPRQTAYPKEYLGKWGEPIEQKQ
jgi:hypothetical protein